MSAPKPPSPKKINPYEGVASDADTKRAMDALGIDKVNKDSEKRNIDKWLLNEQWEKESQRKSFVRATRTNIKSGDVEKGDKTVWALNQALSAEQDFLYEQDAAKQNAVLEDRYKQQQKDQKKSARKQQKMMEEMMNQPVYMPQQGTPPTVQKPQQQIDPLLPAPVAPNPMQIGAPPTPEMAASSSQMAIVRTPKSTRSRSRGASRGTSSLINR